MGNHDVSFESYFYWIFETIVDMVVEKIKINK